MQKYLSFYLIVSLLACGLFLTLFPYPTFYNGTYNLSKTDISKINNYTENETYDLATIDFETNSPALVKLDWFNCVTFLMPKGTSLTAVDVKTGISFNIIRIGGYNHADISPTTENDYETIEKIFSYDDEYQKRPIIIEIQPDLWCPASMSGKMHDNTETLTTHFCLHFSGSKSHSTNMSDGEHQKIINTAFKLGKAYLKQKSA